MKHAARLNRQWGFSKVCYRGLQKNATRAFSAPALTNIYMSRGTLLAQVRLPRAIASHKGRPSDRKWSQSAPMNFGFCSAKCAHRNRRLHQRARHGLVRRSHS